MAEAYMMRLAPHLGRESAHELVYDAAQRSRENGEALADVLRARLPADIAVSIGEGLAPESYVGQPEDTVNAAVAMWRSRRDQCEAQACSTGLMAKPEATVPTDKEVRQ
jgi:3-carboxy-cis,cis-muconate cycloisomerase